MSWQAIIAVGKHTQHYGIIPHVQGIVDSDEDTENMRWKKTVERGTFPYIRLNLKI